MLGRKKHRSVQPMKELRLNTSKGQRGRLGGRWTKATTFGGTTLAAGFYRGKQDSARRWPRIPSQNGLAVGLKRASPHLGK